MTTRFHYESDPQYVESVTQLMHTAGTAPCNGIAVHASESWWKRLAGGAVVSFPCLTCHQPVRAADVSFGGGV